MPLVYETSPLHGSPLDYPYPPLQRKPSEQEDTSKELNPQRSAEKYPGFDGYPPKTHWHPRYPSPAHSPPALFSDVIHTGQLRCHLRSSSGTIGRTPFPQEVMGR
jgi:hypothetical protein